MAMVVVFANNQTLFAINTFPSTVYTDPVPMNGYDRLSCILDTEAIGASGGGGSLVYTAQVSNDGGANWVDTAVTDTATAVGLRQKLQTANGALVRFKFAFSQTGGAAGDMAAITFDLHVNFDKA